jgi:tetratricopeptide (TPR) repeat protein
MNIDITVFWQVYQSPVHEVLFFIASVFRYFFRLYRGYPNAINTTEKNHKKTKGFDNRSKDFFKGRQDEKNDSLHLYSANNDDFRCFFGYGKKTCYVFGGTDGAKKEVFLMSYKLAQFLDRGADLKRQGYLKEAMDCYIQALKVDPEEMSVYLGLGKVAHLLKYQDLAVRSYLSFAHLQVGPIEDAILKDLLPPEFQALYDTFPKDVLSELPKKSAFALFFDPNTPRHIAHSLIDLSPDTMRSKPELVPYAEVYHAHIYNNGTYETILKRHGLTFDDQTRIDKETYIPYGQYFLLGNIKWDMLSSKDVIRLYF